MSVGSFCMFVSPLQGIKKKYREIKTNKQTNKTKTKNKEYGGGGVFQFRQHSSNPNMMLGL